MAKTVRFQGREYSFPDNATDEQIAQALQEFAPQETASFLERARFGLASSPQALRQTLEQEFGPENVHNLAGEISFRRGEGQPFVSLEGEGLEVGDIADILGELPEQIGATIGGIAGAGAGGIPGAAGGAALGMAGGRAIRQLIGRDLLPRFGIPEVAQPETSAEAAQEIGTAGAIGGVSEILGGGIARGAQRVLAPFARRVTSEAERAIEFFETMFPKRREGFRITLTPAEATETRILDIAENVADASLLGGGRITAFQAARQEAMEELGDRIVNQFSDQVDPDVLGQVLLDTVDGNFRAAKAPAIALREMVEKEASQQGITVNSQAIKQIAEPLSEQAGRVRGVAGPQFGDPFVRRLTTLAEEIPISDAIEIKSRLLALTRSIELTTGKTVASGRIKSINKAVDGAIKEALEQQAPDLAQAFRTSQRTFREAERQFNNKFIRSLINKAAPEQGGSPESVVRALLTKGAVSRIRRIKTAVGEDSLAFKRLQTFFLAELFDLSTLTSGLSGRSLNQLAFGRGGRTGTLGFGHPFLKELIGDSATRELRDFSRALMQAQQRLAEGTGRMAIQFTQIGAAVGLLRGVLTGPSGAIIVGPGALARLFTSDVGRKLLIQGLKLPVGTDRSLAVLARITSLDQNLRQSLQSDDSFEQSRTQSRTRSAIENSLRAR